MGFGRVKMSATPPTVEKSENSQAPAADNTAAPALPRVSIFNLPQGIKSKDDLLTLCKTYSQVVEGEFFPANPRNQKAAFGFVTTKTQQDADFLIYRLDGSNLGGKTPVKAMLAQDRPKREGFAPGQQAKKTKVKKPITPLTVLTPKNLATNAPPQQDPLNGKAGWDLNKPVQQVAQGQQKPRNNPKNNQPANGQGQTQAAPKNNSQQAPKPKATQQANSAAPAQNAAPAPQATNTQNQGTQNQQGGQQNQTKKVNQPGQNKRGPNNKSGQQQVTGSPAPAPAAQGQNPQPKPNQGAQQTSNQNQTGSQTAQQTTNQNQTGKAAKKRKNKKNPETQIRYRVNVVDTKNNLPLHVIELNQGQYDKFVLPLVTKH